MLLNGDYIIIFEPKFVNIVKGLLKLTEHVAGVRFLGHSVSCQKQTKTQYIPTLINNN